MLTRTTVTIPEELMAEVDRLAGPRGRSAFVAAAVEEAVKRERLRQAIEETRGVLAGSETWGTADDVYRWVREQRIDRDE
jgi:metal-responsive CopG/Arc/MetJ family transcriptional regulator